MAVYTVQFTPSRPTLGHVRVPPAADIARPLPNAAMRAFDQVGRRQTFVQAGGNLEPLQREHLLEALSQAARGRGVVIFQLPRDLLQPLLAFFRTGKLERRAH